MRGHDKWHKNFESLLPTYVPLVKVQRPKFWNRAIKPKITRYEFDGETHISMSWPSPDSLSTSASPAHQHGFGQSEADPKTILRIMTEALDLPGVASDYHFIIQQAHEKLYKNRKSYPQVYPLVEKLCLLDIALVEVCPEEVFGYGKPFRVIAFHRLSQLY